ncbi:MAG: type II toxin-antitoxin system prevent-host-death family antitoxin [Burkholderiales bacterium]|uniref:Antitoxin n=1 Tax=Ottowia pentelensis TaxID=511108 RepID=A0ABV6PNW7_9BURK|nr:type II toxin-antitoxin system prevent-host-death family antitoxin [Ottowia sp.]MBN9404617.1 type II toxin-antitoxin system prevent-host-death family antitoxin [Burkholderiales bacterium]MBS0400875.1 type II toxin-antitoxin system prevent-host-death family antitoxin [Pseudomonadota bacterium]MBS0415282.1 type II toxin-antitoxin system prevent-host-death family antitoxin [Pseudomonadota bacterium]
MQQVTSAEAQNRFGQLLDMAQREPVAVTRHGRTAGYVIGPADMQILMAALERRTQAQQALEDYARLFEAERAADAPQITDEEIAQEIKAVRAERRALQKRQRA